MSKRRGSLDSDQITSESTLDFDNLDVHEVTSYKSQDLLRPETFDY